MISCCIFLDVVTLETAKYKRQKSPMFLCATLSTHYLILFFQFLKVGNPTNKKTLFYYVKIEFLVDSLRKCKVYVHHGYC